MEFQVRGVRIATFAPRPLGDVGVNVQGLADVVVHQLFDERRHEVVGDLGVGAGENPGRIDVFGHGVNPHPRHFVHAREFVLVVRLVLVEDDGEVQGVVDLLHADGFNDGKLLGRGDVGDVLCTPGVSEGFGAVVVGGVLQREGRPDVARVLPLSVDQQIKRGGLTQRRPRERQFRGLVVRPTGVEVDRRALVRPRTSVVGDVLEIGVIFEDEPVVGRKREGVGKAPIS